jgi:peptidoglycan-associated lipoprotein
MKKLLCIAGLSVVLVACSSTPADQNAAPVDDRNPLTGTATGPGATTNPAGGAGLTGSAIPPGTGSAGATPAGASGRLPINDPSSILYKRSVFYDYDSFVVKDEFKPLIEAHGRYLRDNKSARVIIQGNTDERGGREYNLALGHKRAESVKKMFSILGVQEAQMETVSFGKEKPRNPGSDEGAWAENRRSDLVYSGE